MSNLVSLKKVAEDRTQTEIGIKKVTHYALDPRCISIIPGFNARDMVNMSARTRAHVDGMKEAIRAGEAMPPIVVRVMGDTIAVVEGHCRLTAYHEVIAEGVEIGMIEVRQFNGNDEDMDFCVVDSARALSLTRLEQGRKFKHRVAHGWTVQRIAERVRMSPTYVEQNLMLANANADVQALIESEQVAVKVALDALRKHGELAGAALQAAIDAKGGRLTGSTLDKGLPPKAARRVTDAVANLFADGAVDYPMIIRESKDEDLMYVPVALMRALLDAHEAATTKTKAAQ